MDGIPNQNEMKNTHPFYIVFEVLKVLRIIICKMQPLASQIFYFLLFYVRFYISISFFTNSQSFIQHLSEKQIFDMNFPFLTDSLKPPPPPPPFNDQNLLSVISFLSMLPNTILWSFQPGEALFCLEFPGVAESEKPNFF